jgi:DNA-binding CsgD family transcriptional regulator
MTDVVAEAPKREEQVLVLAAAGLTDKEIAVRLGISPDTVGTYWRRVLARYAAASRTECVAKYLDARAKRSMENLRYVNECLKLVNEHMIQHGVVDAGGAAADSILASLNEWVLVVDGEGTVVFSNRQDAVSRGTLELFRGLDVASDLQFARQGPVDAVWTTATGEIYQFSLSPGSGSIEGHIVACGRIS